MRRLALILFAGLALLLVVATGLATAGIWPWIDVPIMWDGTHVVQAGMFAQIGQFTFGHDTQSRVGATYIGDKVPMCVQSSFGPNPGCRLITTT